MKLVSDKLFKRLKGDQMHRMHTHKRYVWQMRDRRRRAHYLIYWVAGVVAFIILVLIVLGGYGLYNFKNAAQNSYYPVRRVHLRNPQTQIHKRGALSILFMGTKTDSLLHHSKGTDTMIISTVNEQTGRTTMTSLPQNLKVKHDGKAMRLGSVYRQAGPSAAIKSVQKLMKIPVDYYILSDAKGLAETAGQVGGIRIKSNQSFTSRDVKFRQNQTMLMKQKQVMAYLNASGSAKTYGLRQMRNKQVLMALFNKIAHHPLNPNAANSLSSDVRTDLSFNDLERLALHYRKAALIKQHVSLSGAVSKVKNDPRYAQLSPTQKQKVMQVIKQNLGM